MAACFVIDHVFLLKCPLLFCGEAEGGDSHHGPVRPTPALPESRVGGDPAATAGLPPR